MDRTTPKERKHVGNIAERLIAQKFFDSGYCVTKWPDSYSGFDFWLFNVDNYNNRYADIGEVIVIEVKANKVQLKGAQLCASKYFERKNIPYLQVPLGLGKNIVPSPWMYSTREKYTLLQPMIQGGKLEREYYEWKKHFDGEIRTYLYQHCRGEGRKKSLGY